MFNKRITLLTLLVILGGIFLLPKTTSAQTTTTTFTVANPNSNIFYGKFQGFGAEWDPFFWNTNNQNRGLTQADWDLITSRIKELNPGIMRIMMQLSWAQSNPSITTLNLNTPQMQSVLKYLDFSCQNNIDIVLTDWGWTPATWGVSPTDTRFAQGIANYLDEFINKRGYTCIKYLVIGNEPDNEIQKNSGQAVYEQMYRNVDQALRDKGIRNQIKLTGPDMGGQWDFMKTSVSNLYNILDTYDFHRYASTAETSNIGLPGTWESLWSHLDLWRGEVNSRDPNGSQKLLLLTEMGNDGGTTNSHPNIDTFGYALHMADYGTTLLKTRVNGGIAWCMHDIYYFDGGQFMQWGMWKYKNDNWALRPWSQTFALLTNFAPRGSTVAQVSVDGIQTPTSTPALTQYRVSALIRPDGKWSIFLVNRSTTSTNFLINLPYSSQNAFNKYQIDQSTFVQNPTTLLINPASTIPAAASINIIIPAESFIVLAEQTIQTPTSALSPTPTPLSRPCTLLGDTNLCDGVVNALDFTYLSSKFGTNDPKADLKQDGIINVLDYSILSANFGKTL